jgi:hypothetical protein
MKKIVFTIVMIASALMSQAQTSHCSDLFISELTFG